MSRLIRRSAENLKPSSGAHPQGETSLNETPKSDIAPNAQVWRKYVEETDRYDKELVDGWNNSLDMLLIFATLFSAISTAFVIQSSQDLKPDHVEKSAQTLSDILQVVSSGHPTNHSSIPSHNQSVFIPSSTAVAVNTLWFMSLSLSAAVALIAIVAKDWCYQFTSGRSGSFLSQGRRRQLRWEGIEKWKMQEILNVLPLMMHAALLLFAVGLILYLWDINPKVALPVLATTIIVGIFYFVTLFLPLFFRYCPFTTGLMKLILPYWYTIARSTLESLLQVLGKLLVPPLAILRLMSHPFRRALPHHSKRGRGNRKTGTRRWITQISFKTCWNDSKEAIKDRINRLTSEFMADRSQLIGQETPMDDVTSSMLGWMITNCEDPKSVDIAYCALLCTKPWLPRNPLVKSGALEATVTRLSAYIITWNDALRMEDENNLIDLTQIVVLLSQSLSMMSLNAGAELVDGYLEVIYQIWRVLDHSWDSRGKIGYGPTLKELGNLSLHLSDQWQSHLNIRAQLSKQEVLLEEITTRKTTNVPPSEICYLIDGIAKSYLYDSNQSPDLLVKLLNMPEFKNHPRLRRMIGVALTIAYVANHDHLQHNPSVGRNTLLKRAKKLYIELSTMPLVDCAHILDEECENLLLFGLVGILLASPNATWGLNIRSLVDAISRIDGEFTITINHPILGISQQEPLVTMAQWLLTTGEARYQEPSRGTSPGNTRIVMDVASPSRVVHSGSVDGSDDSSAARVRLSEPGHLEHAKHILRLLRGAAIPTQLLKAYHTSRALEEMIQIKFHEQIHKKISFENGDAIPHCMSFLWVFTRSILLIWNQPRRGRRRIDAVRILSPLREGSLPKDIGGMGFTESWIDKLKAACRRNPQNVLESGILDEMIKYYNAGGVDDDTSEIDEHAHQRDTPDRPDSEARGTWLKVLDRMDRICRETIHAPGSEPHLDSKISSYLTEESRMEGACGEEPTPDEGTSRRIYEPVGRADRAMELGHPPEVLEYALCE